LIILGLVLGAVFTGLLIPRLKQKQLGQNIREEGPEAHKAKAGTPSMGGIAIIGAVTLTMAAGCVITRMSGFKGAPAVLADAGIILAGFILFGLLGFMDDYLKVIKKENEGLKVIPKFGAELIIAIGLALYMTYVTPNGSHVYIPIYGRTIDFGFWYIPFVVFALVAMVNAVNLTDGLDGLASTVTAIVSAALCSLAVTFHAQSSCVFCAALMGGCLGFLVFNKNPAKVFMGDTGSLALGGGITVAAIVMKAELFLPILGIIYVLEALSVCMQVSYFKITHGKRIFRMTPLHHHFELGGMNEKKVVLLFGSITAVACILGLLMV
jgi:phospho-N-acetylmuramoyl-pentapeptide-transferase